MTGFYAYVVTFDGLTVPAFTAVIDKFTTEIPNWMTILPHTVFVVSPLTAKALSEFLRQRMPGMNRILVMDAQTDRNGWLPQSAWKFLNDPRPAGK